MIAKAAKFVGLAILWLFALGCATWAVGAFYFDLPFVDVRAPAAIALAVFFLAVVIFARQTGYKLGVLFSIFGAVVGWWFTLPPSNDRPWQLDVAQTPYAEIDGDTVTLHNVRNFDYRSETDYTAHWETRTVRLSQLTGLDLAINYWGSPYMAHPIASFQFADNAETAPVCFSIETRKEIGESYSAIGGLYRQFELIYVVGDERDVLRVRTNYRKGEDIYLYRTTATPEQARARFLEYLKSMNKMRDQPRWYNAITTNCTTAIRSQRNAADRAPWDWRILVNGFGDEMLYENKGIVAGGLSFPELKRQALINDRAKAANDAPDFSKRIREGMVFGM